MSDAPTTFFVIAYDTSDDRTRGKIHKLLSSYGQWTQFSLFECFLTAKEEIKLRAGIDKIADVDDDSIRLYSLCAACLAKVQTIGGDVPEEKLLFIE